MDNITQLFVRACKSADSDKRISSVYRRFYGNHELSEKRKFALLVEILSYIVDAHCPMTTNKLVYELNSPFYDHLDTNSRMYRVLVAQIRFGINSKTHNLRVPLRFKGE